MSTVIFPFEYWPSVSRVQQMYNSTGIWLEQWGTYQKQSHFNRCRIVGVQGPLTLSVPLSGGREQKAYEKDIRIDHSQRWVVQHLRTVRSCYGKAPFFEHYFPQIEDLLSKPFTYLVELNTAILHQIVKWLNWKGAVQQTETYTGVTSTGKAAVLKPYVQVFSERQPFVPGLSILDALLCMGPQSKEYLLS